MSETNARANRFAFWFGSFARNGLMGAFDGVAAVVSDRGAEDGVESAPGKAGRGGNNGLDTPAGGCIGVCRTAGAPMGTSGALGAGGVGGLPTAVRASASVRGGSTGRDGGDVVGCAADGAGGCIVGDGDA